jgi:hypothetical protein
MHLTGSSGEAPEGQAIFITVDRNDSQAVMKDYVSAFEGANIAG